MSEDAHELVCSRCGEARDRPGQRYCRKCAAAYKRERERRMLRAMHLVKKFGLVIPAEPAAAHGPVTREQIDEKPK